MLEHIPVGYSPATLHIHSNSLPLHFSAISFLVRLFHIILMLILNKCIASRFTCMKCSWLALKLLYIVVLMVDKCIAFRFECMRCSSLTYFCIVLVFNKCISLQFTCISAHALQSEATYAVALTMSPTLQLMKFQDVVTLLTCCILNQAYSFDRAILLKLSLQLLFGGFKADTRDKKSLESVSLHIIISLQLQHLQRCFVQ